jgi:pSer/pThr/pTyr-binding forkhead associated (FHA) protein
VELIKLCPACGEQNPATEVICRICMANLSSVAPVSPPPINTPPILAPTPDQVPADDETGSDGTMISRPETLTLSLQAGGAVSVQSGHVLGRHGDAENVFGKFRTVSRRHARVTFVNGTWNIEDLESTNGTWVNGCRIEPKELCPLTVGDTVALSLACEMKVLP